MVLLLRNHEIRGLMPMSEYIDAVEAGYREIGKGQGAAFPRENLWIAGDESDSSGGGHLKPGSKASFKFKAALLPGLGGAGVQAYTAGLPTGLETFMFLFDTDSGALSAIMEVLYYDWLKTAALSALAIRQLMPPDSGTIALFGTGRHARSQLHALKEVVDIKRINAYSRDAAKRRAFCDKMSAELDLDIEPAASPKAALEDADIVITITNAATPVFDGRDLPDKPLHINALGAHYPWAREIDDHTVVNSRVFVDEMRQGLAENGEIRGPLEAGLIQQSHIVGDLGMLVAGVVDGRAEDTRWTLFLSGGTGIEDVAVARRLVDRARERGIGAEFAFNQAYAFEF